LTLDHELFGLRREYLCKRPSPADRRTLSIQPQHNATSPASAAVIALCGEPFLATFTHTPAAWSWWWPARLPSPQRR
jgi:hypothetical protein